MNFHAPARSYSADLAEHYAAVRARLDGFPTIAPAEIPTAPILLLPAPTERHEVLDLVPNQRGKEFVMPIGAEAEIVAGRRALAMFARLREEKPSTNSVRHLQMAIASAFKVDIWVIIGRSRKAGPVRIRHIALMLAHCCCKTSREDVSRRFDRNHATVMYAEKKLAAFLDGATSQIGGGR
jgi:hypothetical protein